VSRPYVSVGTEEYYRGVRKVRKSKKAMIPAASNNSVAHTAYTDQLTSCRELGMTDDDVYIDRSTDIGPTC